MLTAYSITPFEQHTELLNLYPTTTFLHYIYLHHMCKLAPIAFLSHLFPMPCGAGSTVPRLGFDPSVIMPFFLVCCGCDTSYIVSVHIQCQASIYTLSLCRGHSWQVRLAKQETLTPPGHLVSPLVCRGPWISTVVLYCWCHSDSASILLYFTLFLNTIYIFTCEVSKLHYNFCINSIN